VAWGSAPSKLKTQGGTLVFTGLESPVHILILLLVCLLVFGPKRLPEIGRSVGSGVRGFMKAVAGQAPHGRPDQLAADSVAEAAEPAGGSEPADTV
jgi:sec-independent protein translocase protein TatA